MSRWLEMERSSNLVHQLRFKNKSFHWFPGIPLIFGPQNILKSTLSVWTKSKLGRKGSFQKNDSIHPWISFPFVCTCPKDHWKLRESKKNQLVPHHALVSLSNLWQSASSLGLKDIRRQGSRGSQSWGKINTALWNKKWRLFTFHWSDDAGETPQSAVKLKE